MLAAVLATMIALTVADRERPVWELVADRDLDALRDPLKWSALAGVTIALYMWVWPPGILLVGITGVYFLVQMVAYFVRDDSPEHIAFVAGVAMTITAVLMAVKIRSPGFSATGFTRLQVLLPLAVGGGAVFLAWVARLWESQSLEQNGYPVAVAGLVSISLVLFFAVLPDVFSGILNNLLRGSAVPVSRNSPAAGAFRYRADRE
jgi:dolichyl-diphosphooligosaccharide--protein glycosyltransferase